MRSAAVKRDPVRRTLVLGGAALLLAGCFGAGGPGPPAVQPDARMPTGEVIGTGSTTVALLLPQSAGGGASGLAEAFRNTAELALAETGDPAIRILVKDSQGEESGARFAAEAAIAEGARLILGPVFAPAVAGAGAAARAAAIPVIAFSTDAGVAGNGVYLLSFLPRQDAQRIISYAASEGRRGFAALVPSDAYGLVMEAAFREAAARAGVNTVAVERYAPGELAAKARSIAARGPVIDAVFIPAGGGDPAAAAEALFSSGLDPAKVKLLGSGQWDSPAVLQSRILAGAWYPGALSTGFADFARRYEARYGTSPPRTASLVYDAVLLANGLVRSRGPAALNASTITSREGFAGIDGVFRLTPQGLSERGLAVFEVVPGSPSRVVSPPPTRFTRSF